MAGKEISLGATGDTVRQNVARIRRARDLTYADLSRLLEHIGRPIPPLGLRRIESGERRVDVDDLMGLAVALWVNPARLLLPPTVNAEDSAAATGIDPISARDLWQWARDDGHNASKAAILAALMRSAGDISATLAFYDSQAPAGALSERETWLRRHLERAETAEMARGGLEEIQANPDRYREAGGDIDTLVGSLARLLAQLEQQEALDPEPPDAS